MMDINQVTIAVTDLKHMNAFALDTAESLLGSETDPEVFQMPAAEANRLMFVIFDMEERLEKLLKMLGDN
jgi:hypothetical protein